ncbi:MAG: hypothetical protein OHK0018_16260 [Erythrobacter tepidarius]
MSALPPAFVEDRALRDAARAVLEQDIARLRASLDQQGVASRVSSSVSSTVTSRIKAGAADVLAQARASAADHPGIIALVIGAILLWLMRGTLLDLIETALEGEEQAETDTQSTPANAPPSEAGGASLPPAIEEQAA